MRFIFKTDNPIEAHVVTHMLEEHGIMAQVIEDHASHKGHFLGGGILAGASARVSVIDDEAEEALELIKNWEEENKEEEEQTIKYEEPTKPSSFLIPLISMEMLQWIVFTAIALGIIYKVLD